MRRRARHQEKMQDEYAKVKNKLKNMDIELHTEVCLFQDIPGLLWSRVAPPHCFAPAH